MTHYIIIANGSFLPREIILEAIEGKTIIALDGAANKLARIGIKPHFILGDFDSTTEAKENWWGIQKTFAELTDEALPYQGNYNITIVPAKNQNLTDLVKAIQFCDTQNKPESITIICATGGRLDHHEGVMRSLRTEYKKERPIYLHTEQQTIRFAANEMVVIKGRVEDKCGVIAYPAGEFSSEGLAYNGEKYPLNFGFSESICNFLIAESAKVNVSGEALVIMPPQLASQRAYMGMSEVQRLEILLRDAKQMVFACEVSELNEVRAVRKKFKKDHLTVKRDKEKMTFYISEPKEKTFSGNQTRQVLFAMSGEKLTEFLFFQQQIKQDKKNNEVEMNDPGLIAKVV